MTARDPRGSVPQRQRPPATFRPGGWRRHGEPVTGPWPADEPPSTTPRSDWRADVRAAVGLNLLAGVWLILSPWIVGYTDADASWNAIVFGAIVATLALVRLAMPARTAALGVVNAAIGVWLFISGFWLADSDQASWNVWVLGVIVFVLAVFGLAVRRDAAT